MFAPTMALRLPGILDGLIAELYDTPSSSRRARLIRKLALSHMRQGMEVIVPYLREEGRVGRAAVEGLISFGEDARATMLAILGDDGRREMHRGAVRVLAGIVRARRGHSA